MPRAGSPKRPTVHAEARSQEEKEQWLQAAKDRDMTLTRMVATAVRAYLGGETPDPKLLQEKDAEIERLRAELQELREDKTRLRKVADSYRAEALARRDILYAGNLKKTEVFEHVRNWIRKHGTATRPELLNESILDPIKQPIVREWLIGVEQLLIETGEITDEGGVLVWAKSRQD